MNILPHKSWHVRTKANIARVRKDEAKAAEEEKERQRRIELAESEARTSHLREKAKEKFYKGGSIQLQKSETKVEPEETPEKLEHVNLFRDVEQGIDGFKKTNEEHEKEEKEMREKYEKSIGYLTYLGQDTKVTNWYEKKRIRDEETETREDVNAKTKEHYDPLHIIQKYVGKQKPSKQNNQVEQKINLEKVTEKRKRKTPTSSSDSEVKSRKRRKRNSTSEDEIEKRRNKKSRREVDIKRHKKRKNRHRKKEHKKLKKRKARRHSSSEQTSDEDSDEEKAKTLEKLRQERLKREREEKIRAEKVLAKLRGETVPEDNERERLDESRTSGKKQKYNSQYNPEIAKQNKND